ncbi:MAG TPA: hypothetical protein DCG53_12550 [Syntrophus sp. (in: bacteria)]|jgi:general secretion pathway protein J|nr:hypothetical protein [Syntrophus sp. (in: bacteria)]
MQKRGFTLIEILIAIFILSVVLSTVYAAYWGTFRMAGVTEYESEIYTMARTTMNRVMFDLSALSPYDGKMGFIAQKQDLGKGEFTGLLFLSKANIAFDEKEANHGTTSIAYYVREADGATEDKKKYSLIRMDGLYGGPNKGVYGQRGFSLCERVQSLVFLFYDNDGKEYETWDSTSDNQLQKNKAPVMVTVQLTLENPNDRDHPYIFSTRMYLPFNRIEIEGTPAS